ncbi:MAG: hypothetical protein R3C09_17685 [Pirellulaceae bacterium]
MERQVDLAQRGAFVNSTACRPKESRVFLLTAFPCLGDHTAAECSDFHKFHGGSQPFRRSMLLTHDKWRSFTSRPIPPMTSSEMMLCLSCEGRAEVDKLNDLAAKHGGTADINAMQDYGFMYNRNLANLDGHVWEMMWMDMSAMPPSEMAN